MSDMKRFDARQQVTAKPMTRQAYNDLRGWELPVDECGNDDGYLTVDINADSNFDGYDGHVSWKPKALFDDQFYEVDEDEDNTVQYADDTSVCDDEYTARGYYSVGGTKVNGSTHQGLPLDQDLMREVIGMLIGKHSNTDRLIEDANKVVSAIMGRDSQVEAVADSGVKAEGVTLVPCAADGVFLSAAQIKNGSVTVDRFAVDMPNSVTKEQLDKLVADSEVEYAVFGDKLTVAVITLPNKFKVTGEASCVDANNFDKALGEQYALKNATDKLWELEGYLLANDRYRAELASKAKEGNSYEDNASCSECKRSYLS